MSTHTTQPAPASQYDHYIDDQLEKTRVRIKTVDLFTGLFTMAAWTLGVLLVFALIDSWIWPLGTVGRCIGLILLLGGFIFIGVSYVLPLFLKKINPRYAARMIEQSKPRFKNSLINYLWTKAGGSTGNASIANAMSRAAAEDLSQVSASESVDQSHLIRSGFIVVGLTIIMVLYAFISPKSPLSTVARVLSPFSDISRPAIVRVLAVEPGDADLFFGDTLEVTAKIRGRHEPTDVQLIFTTEDGQYRDVPIDMIPTDPGTYFAELRTNGSGIQQSLKYKVVALDGESSWYNVNVRPQPSVSIESLRVTPPAYTGLPVRTITGNGEVSSAEGAKVLINAVTNMPAKIAYIEYLNADGNDFENLKVVNSSDLIVEDNKIWGTFILTMNSKRSAPAFTHYRLRYETSSGEKNQNANVYPVGITPDLAPEIEIIEPTETEISLSLIHI